MITSLPHDIINIIVNFTDDQELRNFLKSCKHIGNSLSLIDYEPLRIVYDIEPCLLPTNYFILEINKKIKKIKNVKKEHPKLKLHLNYDKYNKVSIYHNWHKYELIDEDFNLLYSALLHDRRPPKFNNVKCKYVYYTDIKDIRKSDENCRLVLKNVNDITIDKDNIRELILISCSNITIKNHKSLHLIDTSHCSDIIIPRIHDMMWDTYKDQNVEYEDF